MKDKATGRKNLLTFLTRLNWKINTGSICGIKSLSVDTFRFVFCPEMEGDAMGDFAAMLTGLDMDSFQDIISIWTWLHENNIRFRLRFCYNSKRSVLGNLRRAWLPCMLDRVLTLRVLTLKRQDLGPVRDNGGDQAENGKNYSVPDVAHGK